MTAYVWHGFLYQSGLAFTPSIPHSSQYTPAAGGVYTRRILKCTHSLHLVVGYASELSLSANAAQCPARFAVANAHTRRTCHGCLTRRGASVFTECSHVPGGREPFLVDIADLLDEARELPGQREYNFIIPSHLQRNFHLFHSQTWVVHEDCK